MKSLITLAILMLLSSNLQAQGFPEEKHIIVSGSGFIEHMPDYAEVYLTTTKTSETLKISKENVDSITQKVLDAALSIGIKPEDIGASKIHAEPHYKWIDNDRKYLGERVSRSITLILRDLSQYSPLIQAVINAGVTELDGVQFKFNDRNALKREAMQYAIIDAKKKAEVIARQFGSKVNDVYKISEKSIDDESYYRSHQYAMLADVAMPTRKAELKVRKQRIDESIYAVFILK